MDSAIETDHEELEENPSKDRIVETLENHTKNFFWKQKRSKIEASMRN